MAPTRAAPTERNDDPRLQQFMKTRMCKFHLLGMCVKGPACMFAHRADELQTPPDLRCTKLCKRLIDTGVCGNKDCSFAHHAEELRTTSAFHKTKLCRFNQMGHCTLGSKCNFAHSHLELQQVEALEGQVMVDTWNHSAKASCADEALLDAPPGLGEDNWGSSPSWVVTPGNPAYVPVPGSYSPYSPAQDMNMACYSAYDNFASMWGMGADVEVDQADGLWQMKRAFIGGEVQPYSIRTVRTSETTLCSLADRVDEDLSDRRKTENFVN